MAELAISKNMSEQDLTDLKLHLNRIEEKLDLLAQANGQKVSKLEVPRSESSKPRRTRSRSSLKAPRSFVSVVLFLFLFSANWIMVFGTLPAVIDLPTGVYTDQQRELLLGLRYMFVVLVVPFIHWLAPDVSVATFVGFIAGHLAIREVAYGYSAFGLHDEREVYLHLYKSGALVALLSYVSIKVVRGLQ